MKTTVEVLEKKAEKLPLDFWERVLSWKGNVARVKSFTTETIYTVSIFKGEKNGDLNVTCTCPARVPCRHQASFYAVVKNIGPKDTGKANEWAKETPGSIKKGRTSGLTLIKEAAELLVNGVAVLIAEQTKGESNGKGKGNEGSPTVQDQ